MATEIGQKQYVISTENNYATIKVLEYDGKKYTELFTAYLVKRRTSFKITEYYLSVTQDDGRGVSISLKDISTGFVLDDLSTPFDFASLITWLTTNTGA